MTSSTPNLSETADAMDREKGRRQATFVVEHLDPELGKWSAREYGCIARECHAAGARFLLTSVPESLQLPEELASLKEELTVERRSVEEIFAEIKDRVCLLDPAATAELSPADGDNFDVFLFGGILGASTPLRKFFFFPPLLCQPLTKSAGDDPPRGGLETWLVP